MSSMDAFGRKQQDEQQGYAGLNATATTGLGSKEQKEVVDNKGGGFFQVAKTVGAAAAGVALVGWAIYRLLEGSGASSSDSNHEQSSNEKLMKAPGSNGTRNIPRKGFEENTAKFFRDERSNKKVRKAEGSKGTLL